MDCSSYLCDEHSHCEKDPESCSPDCVCNNGFIPPNCTGNFKLTPGIIIHSYAWGLSDIDECADGSANCSVDAACNNTDGGYTCTCYEGLEGNGFECYGELHAL